MIYVYYGDVGGGKTLGSLELMEAASRAGRFVATNIRLTSECPFVDKVALIGTPEYPIADERARKGKYQYFWEYMPENSLIVIDEGDIYFDSSDHGEFKMNTKVYHKQHRKFGHDIVYIVQRVSNLYKRIRDLAARFIACEHNYRTHRLFRALELTMGKEFALQRSSYFRYEFASQDEKECRGWGRTPYAVASRMFGWYDTRQLLGQTDLWLKRRELANVNATESEDVGVDAGAVDGARGDGPGVATDPVEAVGPYPVRRRIVVRGVPSSPVVCGAGSGAETGGAIGGAC